MNPDISSVYRETGMTRDKYDAMGDERRAPRHCPLYVIGSACERLKSCHPDIQGNDPDRLAGTSFGGFCPEVLYQFKPYWSQDFPAHYLDCPEFSLWWWERNKGKVGKQSNRRRPVPRSVRFKVFLRDGFTCQYCGAKPPEVRLEVDHRIPVSKGGPDDFDNLLTACEECNRGKGDLLPGPDQGQ